MAEIGGSKGLFGGLILLLAISAAVSNYDRNSNLYDTYKGAVYEHVPIKPERMTNMTRTVALQVIQQNLDKYREIVREADRSRVDIIVFPEYGLFGVFDSSAPNIRNFVHPFLETIPDVGRGRWNPCDERNEDAQIIQQRLSCLASDNNMFIVAGLGESSKCNRLIDNKCPTHSYYHYSTTVVFSNQGYLVAKYRRKALLYETYFDSPDKFDVAVFETTQNKFAIVSSYDTMLKEPVMELINKQKVQNIIIPNVWRTESPLLSSVQWHSSFAIGNEVNVLAATVHEESIRSFGSGIYFPYDKSDYHNKPNSPRGKLIIANVKVNRYSRETKPVIPYLSVSLDRFNYYIIKILGQNIRFKFIEMTKYSNNASICSGSFCCKVDYSSQSLETEKYGLGIFKGYIHALKRRLSFEICTVINCNRECGKSIFSANTYFTKFALSGYNFTSHNIYPQMVFMNKGEQILSDIWRYEHGKITSTRIFNDPLHSATLIGRLYHEDKLLSNTHISYNSNNRRKYYNNTKSNKNNDAVSRFTPTTFVVGMATVLSVISFS